MRKTFTAVTAALMLGAGAIAAAPSASAQTIYVQPYGYQTYNPYGYEPYYDPYYGRYVDPYDQRYRYRTRTSTGSAVLGLALGALASQPRTRTRTTYEVVPDPYFTGDPRQIDRCQRRYRSYDPYTNTFVGKDGRYYYCRL